MKGSIVILENKCSSKLFNIIKSYIESFHRDYMQSTLYTNYHAINICDMAILLKY